MAQDRDFVLQVDGRSGSYRLRIMPSRGRQRGYPHRSGCPRRGLGHVAGAGAGVGSNEPRNGTGTGTTASAVGGDAVRGGVPAWVGAFLSSRNEVERAGGRLRILLRLRPAELAMLPWELLFSDRYGGYLWRRSPMVRYVEVPEPVQAADGQSAPLRMLGMTALPGELGRFGRRCRAAPTASAACPIARPAGLVVVDWVPGQS